MIAMSYKLGCRTTESGPFAYNALRFATREEAETYGLELSMRWLALRDWETHESDEPVNYAIKDGKAVRIEMEV
ncbi:hypothetical protein CMI37_20420 [Candidatus Pacearchaeota archaeon]|jgi:hypothetical protein|nr:hypothetical protein [Candidatus Pacearchaeota archaeon]|tara:strand:+ start:2422 stop:2643 length:222 start_codon:yes stop_codon:yes gene_type:complete